MNGSSTTLLDPKEGSLATSRLLGSSVGSISSPRKAKSEISKVYKQAEALFVTRRFSEALACIEPLITIPHRENDAHDDESTPDVAPIARASPKSRIKVWSFYLTLLNAIAELGSEDGKKEFGGREWRNLVAKAQDGSVWDEVVNLGYGGVEGNVDADVVFNLASLLLAQSTTQVGNQRHLESYLSASSHPSLDLTSQLQDLDGSHSLPTHQPPRSGGTDTPRDLNARVRIIELFTLHVLPRTGEWDYARDFINRSEVLDEEIREELSQALRSLEEDEDSKAHQDRFEDAMPQVEQLTEQEPLPVVEETRSDSMETVRQRPIENHDRSNSEQDYGVDKPDDAPKVQPTPPKKPSPKPPKAAQSKHPPRSSPTKSTGKTSTNTNTDPSIYRRSAAVVSALQQLIKNMTEQISQNPMSLLRFVLFLMGLIVAFSRRDVKDRLGRLTGRGWDKVKRTVGMGVKVSYI